MLSDPGETRLSPAAERMRDSIEHRLFASPPPSPRRASRRRMTPDMRAHLARPRARRRWLWLLGVVVVALVVAAVTWFHAIA